MSEKIFDENDMWTDEAIRAVREVEEFFEQLVEKYPEYNVRDLSHIAVHGITFAECRILFERRFASLKEEKDDA